MKSPRPRDGAGDGRAALAVALGALVPLAAFLAALHPGLPAGDSGELIATAATGGVAHPPGYPLWTMLAGGFARLLPAGTVAWRINVFTALCGAAAAGVLAAAVLRATRSAGAALLAAWAFAFAAPAFRASLAAEVFSLNALLAACALLALGWAPGRAAAALAFLAALALSHHHTLILLAAPALLVQGIRAFRAAEGPRERRRLAARTAGAAALGLLPLLWLPFAAQRAGAVAWGEAGTLRGFLALLLRAEYGTFRLDPADAGHALHAGHLWLLARDLPAELGVAALALAAAGAAALALRHRAAGLALAGYAAAQAWFFTRIGFPADLALARGVVERFHVLPLLALAFAAGLGAAWLADRLRGRARPAALALLLGLVAAAGAARAPALSERGNRFAGALGRGILASLPPRAVLFVQGDVLQHALVYLTRVEGLRPDVAVVDQELLTYAWYVRRVRARDPGLLPPLGRAQRIRLADGRRLEGLAIPRPDGTVDLLTEDGDGTLPAAQVAAAEEADPASLYADSRAGFSRDALLSQGEDRYSGLPGTRNLLWVDHLAGKRPVAFLGLKEDALALRYDLVPFGLVNLAHPRGAPPPPAERLAAALEAAAASDPAATYFRPYAATSFEEAERNRLAELLAFAAPLFCQPSAAEAVAAHPRGHERLLAFARRLESAGPRADPGALRAAGLLRACDPAFRDR